MTSASKESMCARTPARVECESPSDPFPSCAMGSMMTAMVTRMRGSKRLASPAVSKQMGALWRVFGHAIPLV